MSQLLDLMFPKYSVVVYSTPFRDIDDNPIDEVGVVDSTNDKIVFIKLNRTLEHHKWEYAATVACNPNLLTIITRGDKNAYISKE